MENSKCNHMKDGEYTIKYDSAYEMRSSQMYCTQCDKSGRQQTCQWIVRSSAHFLIPA